MKANDHPKISFAYPTFIRSGMLAHGPFMPDVGWKINDFPAKLSFYVSAGLILNSRRAYSFTIDVLHEGESLLPDGRPAIDSQLFGTSVSDRDDFVAISTAYLENINIHSEGLYTIRVNLYSGRVEDKFDGLLIDHHDAHFVIAKNWLSNTMTPQETD